MALSNTELAWPGECGERLVLDGRRDCRSKKERLGFGLLRSGCCSVSALEEAQEIIPGAGSGSVVAVAGRTCIWE